MNQPIESFQLAFGDMAIIDDRDLFGLVMCQVIEEYPDKPDYWRRWAARERFLERGGRRISDLGREAQKKYTGQI